MKKNLLAVIASIAFAGTISATAAYADDDIPLDIAQVNKMMSSCQMIYDNKTFCDKDTLNKCEMQMTRSQCQTMINQAAGEAVDATR